VLLLNDLYELARWIEDIASMKNAVKTCEMMNLAMVSEGTDFLLDCEFDLYIQLVLII